MKILYNILSRGLQCPWPETHHPQRETTIHTDGKEKKPLLLSLHLLLLLCPKPGRRSFLMSTVPKRPRSFTFYSSLQLPPSGLTVWLWLYPPFFLQVLPLLRQPTTIRCHSELTGKPYWPHALLLRYIPLWTVGSLGTDRRLYPFPG